jgi:hypothetical protein
MIYRNPPPRPSDPPSWEPHQPTTHEKPIAQFQRVKLWSDRIELCKWSWAVMDFAQ